MRVAVEEKRNQHSLSLMLLEYNKKYTVQYNSGYNKLLNDYSTVSRHQLLLLLVVLLLLLLLFDREVSG